MSDIKKSELNAKMSNTTGSTPDKNIERRVDKLDVTVNNLAENMHDITVQMKETNNELHSMKETILDKIGEVQKPNWVPILSFVTISLTMFALVASVMGIVMTGYSGRLDRHDYQIERLDEQMHVNQCDIVRLQPKP